MLYKNGLQSQLDGFILPQSSHSLLPELFGRRSTSDRDWGLRPTFIQNFVFFIFGVCVYVLGSLG